MTLCKYSILLGKKNIKNNPFSYNACVSAIRRADRLRSLVPGLSMRDVFRRSLRCLPVHLGLHLMPLFVKTASLNLSKRTHMS